MDKRGKDSFNIHMLNDIRFTISRQVSDIFDLYTELHGIRISLFSPDGRLLYPDRVGRPDCHHCTLLRGALNMDAKCRAMDRKMMRVSMSRGGMVTYTCHAGMREAAAPIRIGNELAGYVMLGQFRSEAAPGRSPYAERWLAEQGNTDLQQAFDQTQVFPEDKIETLLSMFRHLLEFIIESRHIQHKDYDLLAPVIDRIHKHPESALSLAAAARLAGRSPSTLTRLFKRVTGRSFKQYQTAFRMEQAARLLESMPGRPVSEVAQRLGYEDPLYFSRIFHKQFDCSPSTYRKHRTAAQENVSG